MKLNMINVSISILVIVGLFLFTNYFGRKIWVYWNSRRPVTYLPVSNAEVKSTGDFSNLLFLHHSTGRNIVKEGNMRELLREKNLYLWDHDYNSVGLTDPNGKKLGICYDIPTDSSKTRGNGNTDPDGLVILFKQNVTNPPSNAFSRIMQHEVIIFKSCFPNSKIESDDELETIKNQFTEIKDLLAQHPEKLFIALTFPPLHPLATTPEQADRARKLVNWLTSDKFIGTTKNLYVFDLFGKLASSETNMLKPEYQRNADKRDSHPNKEANRVIGSIIANFISITIQKYRQND